ncbi:MAG: nucleotidyltransferase domain-containing protein [Deltaproteobacteria bacterium]|nr:nucleotidyltransferase domain-containing protein [Deltaproteobacteria bacterium]
MHPDILQKIQTYFSRQEGVIAVLLFGSRAKGRATAGSDVDVAVLYEENHVPDFRAQMNLKEELGRELRAEVDLAVLNKANPILKHQIFTQGKKILENDSSRTTAFQVRSLFQYDDLKRVRAPIEKALLKGRVYG